MTSRFASNLRVLRDSAQLSTAALAVASGIDAGRLDALETNSTCPSPEELIRLSDALSVGLDRMLRFDLTGAAKVKSQADIRFLVLDVDGVLTDSGVYYAPNGDITKKFNVKDGVAIGQLTGAGFPVGFLSAGSSVAQVQARAARLGVQWVQCEVKSKMDVLAQWCAAVGIAPGQVAFIGDDRNDLPVMQAVGLAACPSDAVEEVKSRVHWILHSKGGDGCVREFVDLFLPPTPNP